MEILISCTAKVAEYTVAPFGRQAGYLIFYGGNFKELADHAKELEGARERMNHSVEEERRNGKVIEDDVLNWLEEVNEVIGRANQLQNDPHRAKARCFGWSFPNLILRHQLSRKAAKIAKDVVQVQGKGKFDRVGYLPPLDEVGSSVTRGGENLETRESFKENIVKALKDPKARNIGVYGLGGVGKTTLVKEVAQIAKQDKLFDVVVMTHVSKTPDIKTIQGEIADLLGLRFEEETVTGREYRLRQRIKAEKTILVILDDIWTRLDLEKVGIPSGNEHNDCKLLMTSRNEDVLLEMDTQKDFTFRLEHLSEAETWSLFQFMAGDVVKDISLQHVAIQVAQKCAGLPLLLVTVARALKNKRDVQSWKDALWQLQSIDRAEMGALTYSALELSYNSLESDAMKALFLLFAALEGTDAEYILRVAMGLDIFKQMKTVDGARNRLHKIIGSLKASCLLIEGNRSGQIQMHDIVREVAIAIAYRDHHVYVVKQGEDELEKRPTKDFLKRCTQIILDTCHVHELPQRLDCPNVKHFNLESANRSLEIPDSIFEGMGNLRVLDLTRLNLSSLPTSLRSLTDLQTLCLDQCILENMDAIGSLKNLEILSLWQSSMIELPSEIGKLTRLRMLDLSNSGIEVIPPNIISSLTKLEELYLGNASIKWEDENSAKQNGNASLAELRQLSNLTTLELQIREAWILPRDLQLMFEKLKRYKIAIGDVWEWPDIEDETLKTLMLKLGTPIHLEHGIKALIKGVENLYLDEVDGIQNVLYQLNGEGFPLLKHLHIQNNANVKHIVDSTKRNQVQVSFLNLETLVLHNLKNLEEICRGPLAVNSFGKLSVIEVKNCVQLKYLLPLLTVKGLSQLSEIEVCQCNSMKEIVLRDNDSSADSDITNEKIEFPSLHSLTLQHLEILDNFFSHELMSSISVQKNQWSETCVSAPFFSAQVAFPKLDTLILRSLNLNNIWDDNQHSMYNLTSLIVENCGGLKYLLSSTMVEGLINLKRLEVSKCHLMDEIIVTEKRNNNGTIALNKVRFSKLETIILKDMENLKTIWHYQYDTLKKLQVKNCEKIVVVFPSSVQKSYTNLEILEVTGCALVEEIFELTSSEKSNIEDTTHLKEIILDGLPKLKKIWGRDPRGILSFCNLENIHVHHCKCLEYLFTLSVATCCSHIKELCIEVCGNMKEIVAQEKEFMCTTSIFEFNQLNTLRLRDLHKLKGFYAGNHTLACPSLRTIYVSKCAKLNLYKSLSTSSPERFQDGKLLALMQQPIFIVEQVIPNLESLTVNHKDVHVILQAQNSGALFTKMTLLVLSNYKNEEATFPYWFLQNVRTLEWLVVEWSFFKKIFQEERLVSEKLHTRLKKLDLHQLPELQHICEEGSQIDPVLELLEHLHVFHCPSLINLLPSSVTFSQLTCLTIKDCNGMINLITSTTARNLAKLTTMKVINCNSLEEIITGKENVDIAFISLEILKLECLPSLNKFSSSKCFLKLPLLMKVVVSECPRMKIFSEGNISTPNLRKVKFAENDEEWHWKGNLNDTIKNMFEDKIAFYRFKHLALSKYPELKDLWYDQLHHNVFRNLKSLVVHRCDFLLCVLFPSNALQVLHGLEELEVRDCDSLETVFDVKGMKSKEIFTKHCTQLKRLTLFGLPKLKHIWNEDPYEIISFGNLCIVDVSECQNLLNMFSLSLCQDLGHLEKLSIESCGLGEIVAMEDGSVKNSFNFPQLTQLVLRSLINLKSFYQGKHTLECPSLKILNVYHCEALRMFSFNHFDFQQPNPVNDIQDMQIQQALFSIEKLSHNLEELAINGTDALRILNSYCQENIFHRIEILHLQYFDESPTTFLNDFRATFPNLVTLEVRNSSFEILFPTEGIAHLSMRVSKQIRNLWLFELEKLKYIWQEDFPLDHPLLQDLEDLSVWHCPSLISLVPSSTSFTKLTSLVVDNCKELIYLITSSTAKSLVQLTKLVIKNCDMILDVVKIDEEKAEEDIIFENLEYLEITSLSSLRRFCYGKYTFMFPSLVDFVVKGCPQMKIFSSGVTIAPFLTAIAVENQKMWWKGDLNTTIEHLFIKQEVSRSNDK